MYTANENRYNNMTYNFCGESGLQLPAISIGLWQNFGINDDYEVMKDIILTAFDNGITHFDLANNYGPEPGRAEINFGKIFKENLKPYRDELIISSKAGYEMWDGPYGGRGGSRKYLTASIDQSLKRTGLEYFDIFYHHCMTPETPLKETALCLGDIVRQGKALYVGISNYDGHTMHKMHHRCDDYNVPFIINQNRYSILDRTIEEISLISEAKSKRKGIIAFSPLAQGLLSDKYANGIPENSRLYNNKALEEKLNYNESKAYQIKQLADMAHKKGMTLSQMAVKWLLSKKEITSVLIGIHSKEQLLENLKALKFEDLTDADLIQINGITGNV